ncbi:hypothetical protein [Rhizobium sp. P44RR-XXIV]|uniref:hypothetical protein n=1 Tax=Rhizobium sp. P44RR-XXIV TaxID=1921145 RepID=UPI000987AA36|nr:hypothetical protein [Rhizobium sp. P44RR-XXIV]TIX90508.1 hypothetical protein BSK43_014650 [Rhizobium sp. P44RR-XXIV]
MQRHPQFMTIAKFSNIHRIGLVIMSKLMTDNYIRYGAKIILIILNAIIISICFAFLAISLYGLSGGTATDLPFALTFQKALSASLKNELSGFVASVVGVLPVVVASVCYRRDMTVQPPSASNDFNKTGYFFLLCLVIGIVLSMINILIITVDAGGNRAIIISDYAVPIKGLFNGIISFFSIYLFQLLGLKPK